jgi:4'-phosphopantetheinyl transferase
VACALARGGRVGVDVERLRATSDILDLARHCFAPSEARAITVLPAADRVGRFTDLWTLKESYIKAIGSGLSVPLDRFAFDVSRNRELRFSAEDDVSAWHFVLAAPTPSTRLAVAFEGGKESTCEFDIRHAPACIRSMGAPDGSGVIRLTAPRTTARFRRAREESRDDHV